MDIEFVWSYAAYALMCLFFFNPTNAPLAWSSNYLLPTSIRVSVDRVIMALKCQATIYLESAQTWNKVAANYGGGGTLPLMTPHPQRYLPPQKNKLWLSCFVILLVTTDGCRYVCRHVCRRTSQNYPKLAIQNRYPKVFWPKRNFV